MFELRVVLHPAGAAGAFGGHRVVVAFARVTPLPAGEAMPVPAELSAGVDDRRQAAFALPDLKELRGEVAVRVVAPDGEVLAAQAVPAEKLTSPLEIKAEPKTYAAPSRTTDPLFGRPAKIRGRVIDTAGRTPPAGKQVVLLGRLVDGDGDGTPPRPLVVARTDAQGYFSGAYPPGKFAEAQGVVGVGGGQAVPIPLERDGTFPPRVVLAVAMPAEAPQATAEDACKCDGAAPRQPDVEDLVNAPDAFTADLGVGGCVEFNKPNRTLEEFDFYSVVRTTEPAIQGLTLDDPPRRTTVGALLDLLDPKLTATRPTSRAAEADAAARAIATDPARRDVRIDPARAKALGTSYGATVLTKLAEAERQTRLEDLTRLLAALTKSRPGRGVLAADNPVDWDDEPTFYQAATIAHGHLLHFKQEWVADGYSLGDLLYSLPLAPCQKKQIVVLDWDRRETAARRESLEVEERLTSVLSRDRDISEIARASLSEQLVGGSSATTDSTSIGFGLGFIGEGVAGLLGVAGGSSSASASAFQNASRQASASSLQQLHDRTAQAASAVRSQRSTVIQTVRQGESLQVTTETIANYNHCHAVTIEYFEVLRHFLVRQQLVDVQECLFVPLLMSRFDAAKALRWRSPLARFLRDRRSAGGFDALERIANNYVGSDLPTASFADEELESLEGFLRLTFRLARPRDAADGAFVAAAWIGVGLLTGRSADEFWQNFLKDQADKDRIFLQELGPRIAEEVAGGLRLFAVDDRDAETELPVDCTLVSDFRNNASLYVSVRQRKALPPLRRKAIQFVRIADSVRVGAEETPLGELLPAGSKVIVDSGQLRYRTAHLAFDLFNNSRIQNDLAGGDDVRIFTPPSRQELKKPRQEDRALAARLLAHLNEHLEYYHRVLWAAMDPQRRYMLLDGFEAPNGGGRSVASVVENRLAGVVGNCLVLPVARGFHLDPTFAQDGDDPVDLLEHYRPTSPIPPLKVAVPTKGVFAEAVMGACNSCEKKDESRFWRWEESPCPDQPPAINPVSTDSRRAEPPDLTAKDLPAPIVAIQSAPAAPDPSGLGGLLTLLGNASLFRDVTGLTETQKNALTALQEAFQASQFFGGEAAKLALQGAMARDIDKALDKIEEAKAKGLLTEAQSQKLAEEAVRGMIGGGGGGGGGQAAEPITTEDVKEITETAAEQKANVKVSRTPGGGEELTVDTLLADAAPPPKILIAGLTPARRAFSPPGDKSGAFELTATMKDAPADATLLWSQDPSPPAGEIGAVDLVGSTTAPTIRIEALRPGLTNFDCQLRSGGTTVASVKLPIAVPQFVTIDEERAAFDAFLAGFAAPASPLVGAKEVLVRAIRDMAEAILLPTCNVRLVWLLAPFGEALPAQFAAGGKAAGNVTRAVLRNESPEIVIPIPSRPGTSIRFAPDALLGATGNLVTAGPDIYDEPIDVYPGGFENPSGGELDQSTREVISTLGAVNFSDPVLLANVIMVMGRLIGETLAHEILHSLIGRIPGVGAHSTEARDILRDGPDRTFQERTGIEITKSNFPNEGTFIDHGFGPAGIGGIQPGTQALVNRHFPVPPAFA